MSEISPHPKITTQRPDWLAEAAVSNAPVLRAKFPENREFNREFAKFHGFLAMQGGEQGGIFNDLNQEQGNYFGGTGNLCAVSDGEKICPRPINACCR